MRFFRFLIFFKKRFRAYFSSEPVQALGSTVPLTRDVIKNNGRHCIEFTKIAIVVLNQVIRPFTAKWHKLSVNGAFSNSDSCQEFRQELTNLQSILNVYTKMLGDMAGVEDDLSDLEDEES